MATSHIAAALDSLNDSHTYLIPPRSIYRLERDWTVQVIGERCFVTRVRPNGNAGNRGVKPGDQVVTINGYRIGRSNLSRIEFAFNILRPLPQLNLTLRDAQGQERQVSLEDRFSTRMLFRDDWWALQRIRIAEYGDDLVIAQVPSFMFDQVEVNKLISVSRKHKVLILDLRENRGGQTEMLKALVGDLFDHDIKICDRVTRESTKPMLAKSNHHPFDGKLFVLIDSMSASAAELLARVVQLEKRGVVIGDRSSGSVMEARKYSYKIAFDQATTVYGASITEANLIMIDGQSLEHVGVTPDEVAVASAADLASGRDPVLAHAAEMAGVRITPEDAGKIFPYQWPKD